MNPFYDADLKFSAELGEDDSCFDGLSDERAVKIASWVNREILRQEVSVHRLQSKLRQLCSRYDVVRAKMLDSPLDALDIDCVLSSKLADQGVKTAVDVFHQAVRESLSPGEAAQLEDALAKLGLEFT